VINAPDEEDIQIMKQKKLNQRLDALERDNFRDQESDDDIPAEVDGGNTNYDRTFWYLDWLVGEDLFATPKKRKSRACKLRSSGRKRRLNFNHVIEDAELITLPSFIPTYLTVSVGPSTLPPRHFCSVCGYPFYIFISPLILCFCFYADDLNQAHLHL